jgi:hypothetical protein
MLSLFANASSDLRILMSRYDTDCVFRRLIQLKQANFAVKSRRRLVQHA